MLSIIQVRLNHISELSLTSKVNWTYFYELYVRCDFFTTDLGCIFKLTNCLGDNWSLTACTATLVLKYLQNIIWLEYETVMMTQFVRFTSFFKGANSPRQLVQLAPFVVIPLFFNPIKR